ncbi:MAG: endonuclease domain-containing protein [Halobacteriota archaeon]|jgi:hypothetical protein
MRGKSKNPRTHCGNGHEFTEENTYYPPSDPTHRMCKACRLHNVLEYTERNREKVNLEKRARHKKETKEYRRRGNLRQIGWTLELFNERLEEQKGLCDICGVVLTFEDKAGRTRANADHEYCVPPKPRGILCGNCNIGIGNLQDSIDLLKKATAYLEKYA